MTKSATNPIPHPRGVPILGNALSVDAEAPLQSLMELAREHGPIFRMDFGRTTSYVVSGTDLVEELCDESRFDKAVRGVLRRLRVLAGDGLFTADTDAPNWDRAHNILMPAFSQQSMTAYLPMMIDIADQLVLKWERLNDEDEVDVVHDMTGLALDTIGLCGFGYRFNSFYREEFHPFIDALTRTLETCSQRRGVPFEKLAMRGRIKQLDDDVSLMSDLVDDIIRKRRRDPAGAGDDLLGRMLSGVDRRSGDTLSDENIRYQIITFLIAGHETTSGLLSFALYYLSKKPDTLARAREEVDRVLGHDVSVPPTAQQIGQLDVVRAILMEALRLWPTAPVFSLYPYQDEMLAGRYPIEKGSLITVLSLMLHRDPAVWGDDPESFDPDRFTREAEASRPPAAYKPFGNGQRACIGRQFALQEAILVLGMIIQRFDLLDHTNYELKIKETGSIKPEGFRLRVRRRSEVVRSQLVAAPDVMQEDVAEEDDHSLPAAAQQPQHGTPLFVLYGSNLGSTETLAREIAQSGTLHGFETTLAPLDDYAGRLPTQGAVIIASASYNGQPPDNAASFVEALENGEDGSAEGVSYTVLGCGNRDWASTFQEVPRYIDDRLAALGASRILDRCEADAREDVTAQFQPWFEGLWPALSSALNLDLEPVAPEEAQPLFRVEVVRGLVANPVANRTEAVPMTVLANEELQSATSGRSTRHIEVGLPEGISYQPGDHLCVVPVNRPSVVARAMNHFGFDDSSHIRIIATGGRKSPFPSDAAVSVRRIADLYGELQTVARRKDIALMAAHTQCPNTRSELEELAKVAGAGEADRYRSEVFLKHKSALDLLEEFPACELPFAAYLEMIPWLSPRYYSISSSPKATPDRCSITVGVVEGPARSGHGIYEGVCSKYLAEARIGDLVHAVIKEPSSPFRLPEDPKRPILMIGPGTGLAPFRGFVQERQALLQDGNEVGDALLFFGCRHPDQDYLYRDQLEEAEKQGLIRLHTAFSRLDNDRVYVQDLLRREREAVWDLLERDAVIYVCGDGAAMEPDVKRALVRLYGEERDVSHEEAEAWMESLVDSGRYVLDVWAG